MTGFARLDAQIRDLSAAGDHAGAEKLAASAAEQYPDEWLTFERWRIIARAAAGDAPGAVSVLADVLERGGWYPWDWLVDGDLAPLRSDPRFDALLNESRRRHHEEVARSAPAVTLVRPATDPPWPVLIAMHGNGENAVRTLPWWSGAADAGWLVALPQSGTPLGPQRYGWAAATTGEIVRHVESLRRAGMLAAGPLATGGFSRGGYHALRLAITGAVPAAAAIVVSPAMNDMDEMAEYFPKAGARGLRVAFEIGEDDRQASRAVPRLAAQLTQAGVRVEVTVHAGLARAYPPDFRARLPGVLDELTAG